MVKILNIGGQQINFANIEKILKILLDSEE